MTIKDLKKVFNIYTTVQIAEYNETFVGEAIELTEIADDYEIVEIYCINGTLYLNIIDKED